MGAVGRGTGVHLARGEAGRRGGTVFGRRGRGRGARRSGRCGRRSGGRGGRRCSDRHGVLLSRRPEGGCREPVRPRGVRAGS
ncbi:hypothetical protein C5C67_02900 [Rathayibacter sp. AY1E1]|nr:hypothetical protein C5C67_02900 [Rathayibacter sp. AY1E1]